MSRLTKFSTYQGQLAVLGIGFACVLLFFTAPTNGDFWDSESARNPLNGAFIRDFLTALPWQNPVQWAYNYYYQYPALTVMFYPPMFYFTEALWFFPFGVSHAAAVALICFYYFFFLLGVFFLCRRAVTFGSAISATMSLALAPAMALAARHVMLEVPAYTFLVWATVFAVRFSDSGKTSQLYASMFFALCAVYTKQTAFLVLFSTGAAILPAYRMRLLRNPHFYAAVGIGFLGAIPLALMQLRFASFNLKSLTVRDDIDIAKYSLEGIFYNLTIAPHELGIPLTAFLALVFGWLVLRVGSMRSASRAMSSSGSLLENPAIRAVLAWLLSSTIFFLFVALKTPRHAVLFYIPLVMTTFIAFASLRIERWKPAALVAIPAVIAMTTLPFYPVPYVSGYRQAAEHVLANISGENRIGFFGDRDGSFIFNVRQLDPDRKHTVTRIDKLLLDIKIQTAFGLNAKDFSSAEIARMMNAYHLEYVVAVDDLWEDTEIIANFVRVLREGQFSVEKKIEVKSNVGHTDRVLTIYKNLAKFSDPVEFYGLRTLGGLEIVKRPL